MSIFSRDLFFLSDSRFRISDICSLAAWHCCSPCLTLFITTLPRECPPKRRFFYRILRDEWLWWRNREAAHRPRQRRLRAQRQLYVVYLRRGKRGVLTQGRQGGGRRQRERRTTST